MTNYSRLGKEQEQRIVRWAVGNGFPHADRIVRTGAGKNYEHRADEGDVWLCPGVVVQSKRLSPEARMEREWPGWFAQTEAQRVAAGADVALLVVKREGKTDPGDWWAFLTLGVAASLYGTVPPEGELVDAATTAPIRLTLADAAVLLRGGGYGTPLEEVS